MAAFALFGLASFGSAHAADRKGWFDGGIGNGWPNAESMSGGAWCEDAESLGHMTIGDRLQISAEDTPLLFEATYPKPLGATSAAKDVVIDFSCAFQPFSLSSLPEVPADAKGAVILVTKDPDPDTAAEGTIYYAAWDSGRGKNWWQPSAATGVGTGELFRVIITVAQGTAADSLAVNYTLSDRDTISNVRLRQPNGVSRGMFFEGAGQAADLRAEYEPGASHTLNLVEIPGLVVTNISANGESIGSGYGAHAVGDGADVILYYAAALGYRLVDGYDGILPIGVVVRDTTVDENTPGIPEVEALGKYRIGSVVYKSFAAMSAALKDGDTVEMLADDTLPTGATLLKRVVFDVGGYVLSTAASEKLTIAANVVFKAKSVACMRQVVFYIRMDCMLTLPEGTLLGDYSLMGEDYAYVVIGSEGWVRYEGEWRKANLVEMNVYYPGYFDRVAVSLHGPFGGVVADSRLDAFVDSIDTDSFVQDFYWDAATEKLIDYVYWFDGTWRDAEGKSYASLPTHYVAGDFYPHSTAITFRIVYDMGEVPDATHGNPTGYTIESRIGLGDAVAPSASGKAFQGWTDWKGEKVAEINPVVIGRESECLYDITLYANWGPKTSAPIKLRSATVVPGELAAYYDTPVAAEAAVTAFNADKTGHVRVPEGYGGSVSDYAANFVAVAEGTAMTIMLTEAARENLARRVGVLTLAVASDLANPAVKMVTIRDAEPGFYYSVVGGTMAEGVTKEGNRALAQKPIVELTKPDLGETDKAFYKIKAAVKP